MSAPPSQAATGVGYWTNTELDAYNIHVNIVQPRIFYGSDLPTAVDGIDHDLLTSATDNADSPNLSNETLRMLQYLELASYENAGQESAIHDFSREILRMLGFEERGLLLRSRYAIPLHICGETGYFAHTDICLVHDGSSTILLVVKTSFSTKDPEAQVIAEAIAAFQRNNRRRRDRGLDELPRMTIPCIALVGTRPIFYLVPVTMDLSQAVAEGKWTNVPTEVQKCVVRTPGGRVSEGMDQPDFRADALKHYQLFRPLAKKYWRMFLEDI